MSGPSVPLFIAASYVSHSETASAACSAAPSEAARHASGCRKPGGGGRRAEGERCVINGSVPGVGLVYELTVRKEATRHQLTLINGAR